MIAQHTLVLVVHLISNTQCIIRKSLFGNSLVQKRPTYDEKSANYSFIKPQGPPPSIVRTPWPIAWRVALHGIVATVVAAPA
jgi:hypothetical protein